jgi:hypothetical protein
VAEPPVMPEAALQKAVTDLAALLGIWWYHAAQPRRDNPGWPDLVLIGRRGALFRELKRDGRQPTAIQSEVGRRMRYAGLDWAVWRPADLRAGAVMSELEKIR